MTEDTRAVLGISPGLGDDDQHYAFLDVLAEVIDGKLVPVADPRAEFPNVGNIYVAAEHWIPPYGTPAIWRVRSTRTVEVGARQSEYSAVERGRPVALEIIQATARSDSPDDVRRNLIDGVSLSYSPASTALIQLADGITIGPVRRDSQTDEQAFRCTPDALYDVLGCWSDTTPFAPISFYARGDRNRRTFASVLVAPKPESYYDCSDIEHAVKTIVRLSKTALGATADVTKKQLDTLVKAIATLSVPQKLERRFDRVRHALESGSVGLTQLKEFADFAAGQPTILAEISALKEEVRATEQRRVADEKTSIAKQVAELRTSRNQLQADLKQLQAKTVDARRSLTAVVDETIETLGSRLEKLKDEPASLLAEVALLRPFLMSGPSTSRQGNLNARRLAQLPDVAELGGIGDLLACVERNLTAAGLLGASSKRLAREVVAAAQANQLIQFSGSLSTVVAAACARSFAAKVAYVFAVPVGLLDGESLASALSVVDRESAADGSLGALVIDGANRSAFEAYADNVRMLVVERQLNPSRVTSGVVLFSTLVSGPSSLTPSAAQTELGPILDTDACNLSSKPPTAVPQAGRVSEKQWQQWQADVPADEPVVDEPQSLQPKMEGEESVLWRRTTQNAYARLSALPASAGSTPLQSLVFGWYVPRARYCGVPASAYLDDLKREANLGENGDPRIKRLLAKLARLADPSDDRQAR